jgi:hypothetical protein
VRRPAVNLTPAERLGRVVGGIVAVIGGVILLASVGGGGVSTALVILLVLAGLDLVITGALGHCPLYRKLGHVL